MKSITPVNPVSPVNLLTKMIFYISFSILFTACGDGGGSNSDNTGTASTNPVETQPTKTDATTPILTSLKANRNGSLTVSGKADANSTIITTFPDNSRKITMTDDNGNYTLTSTAIQPGGLIKITSNNTNGKVSKPVIADEKDVIKALYLATGKMPELPFIPSLGINTEAPQGGADTAGMPMPFVDIFRTARPFAELSPPGTLFDTNGWPTKFAAGKTFAKTKLLQGALKNSIPNGQYTVLFDNGGRLEFGSNGTVTNIKKIPGENKYTFDFTLKGFDSEDEKAAADTNEININIRDIFPGNGNYMNNIRIVMPGGTCTGNPFLRVDSVSECPNGTNFESFADRLAADRNAIIFNPDYLLFLRNFRVIRMMNLMEASLKDLCFTSNDCPSGVGTWNHRAKINDAVWGGSDARTDAEDHNGVPVEVMTALANTLQRNIWINIPHIANDNYVRQYAKQVSAELDSSLKIYIEYSNEVWNPGFAGHTYATSKGTELGLNTVPEEFTGTNRDANYFARLRFYSQRAVEIFKIWNSEFGDNTRVVRVVGSFIGDRVLTEQILKHISTSDVDAVAIAPYFFGCPFQSACPNASNTLLNATSVNDIFATIDQKRDIDVKSLDGTIAAIENQLTITNQSNLELISYEGGQHLVTGVFGNVISDNDKPRLRQLFNEANRDPRMKERYIRLLNAWKNLSGEGTTLFTAYTLPQSYYRFGNFGIKEHLNKQRTESPKYDGVMSFQESVRNCWWSRC